MSALGLVRRTDQVSKFIDEICQGTPQMFDRTTLEKCYTIINEFKLPRREQPMEREILKLGIYTYRGSYAENWISHERGIKIGIIRMIDGSLHYAGIVVDRFLFGIFKEISWIRCDGRRGRGFKMRDIRDISVDQSNIFLRLQALEDEETKRTMASISKKSTKYKKKKG